MQAIMLTAPGRLEIHNAPEPDIGKDDVLIRVRACAIDRRDLDLFSGVRPWNGTTPQCLGRQVAGVVEAAGLAVTTWRRGDRVLLATTSAGFAELCVTKAARLIRLPDPIGFEEGAVAQLLPSVVHGIEQSDPANKTVFISGSGPAGMLCAQMARVYGAKKIIVSDLHTLRLRRALLLAADTGINASTEDVKRRLEEETDGRGAAVCMECGGTEASFRNCEAGLQNNGHLVVVGTHVQPLSFDLGAWAERSLRLTMAHEQPNETPILLEKGLSLVEAGMVALRPLLTHVFPFRRAAEAFDLILNHPARTMKVTLTP